MIALTKIRDLDLPAGSTGSRPPWLSAASGLVCAGSTMYVIADDELHLGVFPVADSRPGHLVRLFEGELPGSPSARKLQKPDFEALVVLPGFGRNPHGALLALGSGSAANRRRGVLLGLDALGALHGQPQGVDLSPLLVPLSDAFPEVNIEGAVIVGAELRLLQRGNKQDAGNAVIRFDLAEVLGSLTSGRIAAIKPSSIGRFRLDLIGDVPLTVTDAAALPDGTMAFSAVAEDTDDAFHDGACLGAAIGLLGRDDDVRFLHRLDRPHKIEGIHASLNGRQLDLLAVTDADDIAVSASLLSASIEIERSRSAA